MNNVPELLAGMTAMLDLFKRGDDVEWASGDSTMLIWTYKFWKIDYLSRVGQATGNTRNVFTKVKSEIDFLNVQVHNIVGVILLLPLIDDK